MSDFYEPVVYRRGVQEGSRVQEGCTGGGSAYEALRRWARVDWAAMDVQDHGGLTKVVYLDA